MNLEAEMQRWSQTVYGVAHSLYIANSLKLGNLTTLLESLEAAESWNQSSLGFQSCLPSKEFREGSINLDGRDHEEIFKLLSENIVQVLFINLAVLADECLGSLMQEAGVQEPPNYLTSKAEWIKARIDPKYEWAANGLLELCALRNALVHAGGRLNPAVVAILGKAGVQDAKPGHVVKLSFGDLFRYRRALRTVFGELAKLKAE
ncbi:MAG: hypothetical protein QE485_17180 [Acidovorax sp.]|uniref:hypothetical protein n=1 Tax=Acidovorax sp. TaxID=1872122 RepID=UPI002621CED2|nr:hypothetical protein [Acidovorax sp.]MDH4418946.1 hypothetical protein [Acidovorax sp.]